MKKTLRDLFNEFKSWPDVLNSKGVATASVSSQGACLLISLLPILRHWDIYGAIRQAWATTIPAPPSSLWQECGKMAEPFYCCHFSYHDVQNENATLPNQRIEAEAVLSDLAQPQLHPLNIARRECFAYVYEPKGQELSFYRINAFFQDALQRALAGSAGGYVEPDVYYFAYPIFSGLGRRHFLHVYARPERPHASVGELFQAWRQLHAQLNWTELRNVLVDELEEIDLARLRDLVFKRLEKISKTENIERPDDKRDELVFRLITDQLHLVYPIRCACHNGELGFYDEPTRHKPEVEAERIIGFPWKDLAHPALGVSNAVRCKGKMNDELCSKAVIRVHEHVPIRWDGRPVVELNPVQRKLVEGRQERLIQQEIQFARMVWGAHEATRRETKETNKQLWARHKTVAAAQKYLLLAVLAAQGQSLGEAFKSDAMNTALRAASSDQEMTTAKFFGPLFYLECNNTEDWGRAYQVVLRGGLHELVSEYIETGVVQLLLHAEKASEQVDGAELYNDYPATLVQALSGCIPKGAELRAIHDGFNAVLEAIRNTRIELGQLQKQHDSKLRQLAELRGQFRYTIEERQGGKTSAHDVLRQYLKLANNDAIGPIAKVTINVSGIGFGESAWDNILAKLRALTTTTRLHACIYINQRETVKKKYHDAELTESVLLIGGQIDDGLMESVVSNVPEALDLWGVHIGPWGETFAILVRDGSISTALSLPDRKAFTIAPINAVKSLEGGWLFCALKLRGLQSQERGCSPK